MNWFKRLFLSFFLVTLFVSCTPALAATFLEPEDPPTYLTYSKYSINQVNFVYDDNKEKIKFVLKSDGILRLMSRDGQNDYLSFIGYEDAVTTYSVREIHITSPDKTFYEINTSIGTSGKNNGYWLIGKHKGKWVTYVSLNNLTAMGYTPWNWHRIQTNIGEYDSGKFILTSIHTYMPPGAQFGYERRTATDLQLELYWDENAQWFGMRKSY